MLKYGIAGILVLLGIKLVFSGYVNISSPVCFALIMAICTGSMAASYYLPRLRENRDRADSAEGGSASPLEEDHEDARERRQYIDPGDETFTTSTDVQDQAPVPINTRLAAMEV